MTFKVLIAPGVREKIASWPLEQHVVREFYLRLADDLSASSAPRRVTMTESGMEYLASVAATANVHYTFVAYLRRTDESFQMIDCSCVRTEGTRITWRSPRTDDGSEPDAGTGGK